MVTLFVGFASGQSNSPKNSSFHQDHHVQLSTASSHKCSGSIPLDCEINSAPSSRELELWTTVHGSPALTPGPRTQV